MKEGSMAKLDILAMLAAGTTPERKKQAEARAARAKAERERRQMLNPVPQVAPNDPEYDLDWVNWVLKDAEFDGLQVEVVMSALQAAQSGERPGMAIQLGWEEWNH
jgi:hypothetical protein